MDKPHFIIVGILAIAIGFFALRFSSEDSSDYGSGYGLDGEELAMSGRADDTSFGFGADSREGGRSGAGSMRRSRHAESNRSGRSGRFGSGFGKGSSASRGSADTVTAGRRGSRRGSGSRVMGGGSARVGSGSRSSTRGGSRSSVPSIPSKGSLNARAASSGGSSDRVELLSNKEARVDPFYEGTELDDDPNDDLLLEVTDQDDADRKANVAEGVDESDDGDWLEIGEEGELTFPNRGNANVDAGSIKMEIIPNWNGGDATNNSLMQLREPHQWENSMQVVKNGQFLRFILRDDTGHEADISYKINDWVQGEAHEVVTTWENGQTILWVDGKRVGSNTYPGKFNPRRTTPLHVGSDHKSGPYSGADSRLRFSLFDKVKRPDEIS